MEKSKFIMAIVETYRREVVVEAYDAVGAEVLIEELCNRGEIDLGAEDFVTRDVHWIPGRKVR